MAGAVIRPLRAGDVTIARHVTTESFRRYLALIGQTPEDAPNPYDRLEEAVDLGLAWVAEVDGAIVGVAEVNLAPDRAWSIDTVGVLESHASAGIGRALMERIEADARVRAVPMLRLTTLERADQLWRFYQRLGFTITRRGPPSHGLDAFTRVTMEKPLSR